MLHTGVFIKHLYYQVLCLKDLRNLKLSSKTCFQKLQNPYLFFSHNSQVVRSYHGDGRYPVCFLHITLPPAATDVNVDPNKTRVLLHQQVWGLVILHHFQY